MQASQPGPIITLTTDFGLEDHYVGVMKGVILSRCPSARIVDISHGVPPFSILSGAYTIDQAAPYFPAGTIHVVVVDPGVGTTRKAILLEALDRYFIAPDNGVLSMIFRREERPVAREIQAAHLFLQPQSSTFHGRDVFAPTAASLCERLVTAEEIGPILSAIEILNDLEPLQETGGHWRGRILSIDRFGNVITNFKASEFPLGTSARFAIHAGGKTVTSFHPTFGAAPHDICFAYAGSSAFIELGINGRSAARYLNVSAGDAVSLQLE